MKRKPEGKADWSCLWWYLASFLWFLGALLLAGLTGLPLLAAVLLMVPGCIAGLHGWGLLYELDKRSQENRPVYYAFLDHYKIRYFPFMYFFVIFIILLV